MQWQPLTCPVPDCGSGHPYSCFSEAALLEHTHSHFPEAEKNEEAYQEKHAKDQPQSGKQSGKEEKSK